MKTTPIASLLILVGLASSVPSSALSAVTGPQPEFRTEVVFLEPEKFTDVRERHLDNEETRNHILTLLKTYLQERAQAHVPEGGKLSVTINDVDLAGDFEPWRGPAAHDVRIVKDIYAPRISLTFQLTNAAGEILKQGTRKLRNLDFMSNSLGSFINEPYRHEKTLIDDWLRDEFPRSKKKKS